MGGCPGRCADVLVVDELVAVGGEQVARRVLEPEPDHRLAVLLELEHERREVRVARDDDERVDVLLGVRELHRVDAQTDVRRVLAGDAALGYLGQFDAELVERGDVLREPSPVGVRALTDDLALLHQALEHSFHVERLDLLAPTPTARLLDAERQVLEVDEDGECVCLVGHSHPPVGTSSIAANAAYPGFSPVTSVYPLPSDPWRLQGYLG